MPNPSFLINMVLSQSDVYVSNVLVLLISSAINFSNLSDDWKIIISLYFSRHPSIFYVRVFFSFGSHRRSSVLFDMACTFNFIYKAL